METILHSQSTTGYIYKEAKESLVHRFLSWCDSQEENRLGWLGIIVAGHGCVVTPMTIIFILLAGNPVFLWPFVIGAIGMALVTNLAALSTKITIPLFFFSVLIDLSVIIYCISSGLSLSILS